MMEDNRSAVAPVLVKNFHSIFGFDKHDTPFRDRAIAEYACPDNQFYIRSRKNAATKQWT
jgi:hypothetical protein